MIKALYSALRGSAASEVIRQLLGLPRYTPQQVILVVRKDIQAYLKKLEELTLNTKQVDSLKLILSQPVDSVEQAQEINSGVTEVFDDFFSDHDMEEPNPLYDQRWFLALMSYEQYVSTVNSLNAIYQRFLQARTMWIKSQMAAIEVEMGEDIEAERAYNELTQDLGPMLSDELVEA
jgi:hypothetical protein